MSEEFEPFDDPHDGDYQESGLDEVGDIHDPVGASPVSDGTASGKPNRKGLYIIAAVVIAFVGLWVFAGRLEEKKDTEAAAMTEQVVEVDASATAQPASSQADDDGVLADLSPDVLEDMNRRQASSSANTDLVNPGAIEREAADARQNEEDDLFGDFVAPPTDREPVAYPGDEISQALDGDDLLPPPDEGGDEEPGDPASDEPPAPRDSDVYIEPAYQGGQSAREMALEDQLRKEAEMQRIEERKQLERERLRAASTLIAQNDEVLTASAGGAVDPATRDLIMDAFGDDGEQLLSVMGGINETSSAESSLPVPPGTGGNEDPVYNITPGKKVQAVTVSEFISGQDGAGIVEARLTSALRDQGSLILPAGTRAFGDASASGGEPGVEARVAIRFHTFVKPNGQVIRTGLTATAADPHTLSGSVRGDVDNNYVARIARGGAATAIDFFLTQGTERRSIYEQPSPRDRAIDDARERASGILGAGVGDETAVQSVVKLPMETPIMLVFGLNPGF